MEKLYNKLFLQLLMLKIRENKDIRTFADSSAFVGPDEKDNDFDKLQYNDKDMMFAANNVVWCIDSSDGNFVANAPFSYSEKNHIRKIFC